MDNEEKNLSGAESESPLDAQPWRPIESVEPPIHSAENPKPYVLAVDAKGRMSVGYVRNRQPCGWREWMFAKPIGSPTHWMPLPSPPSA